MFGFAPASCFLIPSCCRRIPRLGATRIRRLLSPASAGTKPLPVDRFAPNPFGLYQVHGNVWEWVEDCATDDVWLKYTKAPLDGSPQVAAVCPARLMRGGAWDDNPRMLRSAQRYYGTAAERNYAFGFRVARNLER